jgi:hypothetical protein
MSTREYLRPIDIAVSGTPRPFLEHIAKIADAAPGPSVTPGAMMQSGPLSSFRRRVVAGEFIQASS